MANTTNLVMPLMSAAQSQKHLTHNDAIMKLDVLVQLAVISAALTVPPVSPTEGDRYIVGSAATGAWSGKDLNVAYYASGVWQFAVPREGWQCYNTATDVLLVWTGAAWTDIATAGGFVSTTTINNNTLPGKLTMLGLGGATADTTNRLSANTAGVLFNNAGTSIGVTLNKNAAGNDARFVFQTGFSTRVLFGLLANDDFSISVSPDGSTFYSAMAIDKDTGNVAIGAGSDGTNRLLVSGSNMLFTSSGDLSFTFNKGVAADDVSLTFQTGFSARALVGLLGDDDFTFKVTPDGSSYHTSFVIDKDNGQVNFKQLTGHERGYTTIVSNAITVTSGFMNLTGAGPATLTTINGGFDGAEVTLQHTGGGTVTITNAGNIKTLGGTSMVLDNWNDTVTFICNGTGTWLCKAFCSN